MIRIVDCGSEYAPRFSEIFTAHTIMHDTVSVLRSNGVRTALATGYVISGAPILLTETDPKPYLDALRFLTEIDVPVLGVCFGHQVLGLLHGATIRKGNLVRGSFEIDFLRECGLFTGIRNGSRFHEYHEEFIGVPDAFEATARSGSCENEAMQHVSRPLFGTQFHPEVSGEAGERLLMNFANMCKT